MNTDGVNWDVVARLRAERLLKYIETNAPDVLIGSGWFLLSQALERAYGADVFESARERWTSIRESLDEPASHSPVPLEGREDG